MEKKLFDNVTMVPPMEGESMPRLCEIRFDCSVTAYDVGYAVRKTPSGIPFLYTEKSDKRPQWFRNHIKLDLNTVRDGDPYEIGMMVKQMYQQLELHIKQYEEKR